jgi:hypothetical protein
MKLMIDYRLVQDRLSESDFDRIMKNLPPSTKQQYIQINT